MRTSRTLLVIFIAALLLGPSPGKCEPPEAHGGGCPEGPPCPGFGTAGGGGGSFGGPGASPSVQTSRTCHFSAGPKAGQTQSFVGVPGVVPAPVGGPCTDAMGSWGVAVPDSTAGPSQ